MTQRSKVKELGWPSLKWRHEFWLAAIPFLLSFLVFFFPDFSEATEYSYWRFLVGLPLLFAPLEIPLVIWSCKCLRIAASRICEYPRIYKFLKKTIRNCNQLREDITELVIATKTRHLFEITKASFYEGKYIIVIKKVETPLVEIGHRLVVVHTSDNRMMGNFGVFDSREREYYARNIGNIDSLWSGYIRSRGEVTVNPELVAIYLPQGETDYE